MDRLTVLSHVKFVRCVFFSLCVNVLLLQVMHVTVTVCVCVCVCGQIVLTSLTCTFHITVESTLLSSMRALTGFERPTET